MGALDEFKKGLLKALLFAMLSLFLIPAASLLFVQHAEDVRDREIVDYLRNGLEAAPNMSAADKAAARAILDSHTPSSVCGSDVPALAEYKSLVCRQYSEVWQYHLVERIATGTLIAGVVILVTIVGLGGLAYARPAMQYPSFVFGWNFLRLATATEVLVQGALLVWLSFWVTAFFWNHYYLKLILIAAVLAGGAAFLAIVGIFKRPGEDTGMAGEVIGKQDAPALWQHLRDNAQRLGTAPPDHVVAGIDANFFVTQSPLTVANQTLTGRTLYVSLPLLRVLDRSEADAVLAHELAHFSGGDTAKSAALGPKLVQYDHYCHLMYTGGTTIAVFHLIYLYRIIFQMALGRDKRDREFRADRLAARMVAPQAITTSLLKVVAYANYRAQVEQQLYEHSDRHKGSLGIAGQVAGGLAPYATSARFVADMQNAHVPHPFDSHPPLTERMANVGFAVSERDYGAVVTREPQSTWVTDIATANAIEGRLWAHYERQFASQHEESLAYRYEPANDAERTIVLKFFPPVTFKLKKERAITISHEGIELPDSGDLVEWDRVKDFKYENGMGGDVMQIVHPEKGLLGDKTTKVKLPGIKDQREQFKGVLGHYWNRHRVMRNYQTK